MTLKDYFTGYQLTPSQEEALVRLTAFFDSAIPCFLLKGYTGTGKTFLMKGLIDYLKSEKITVLLTAPTGRAAQVLTEKTGYEATTIHRMLYFGEKFSDTAESEGQQYDIYKIIYGTSANDHPANTVYISDEASMISNVYAENDLMKFGSGYLMSDLVSFIWPDPANSRRKLIFVGDTAQLPPVDMNTSPALDAAYLNEKFHIACMEHELTHVVRQKESGAILGNATMLREHIAQSRFGSLRLSPGADVHFLASDRVVGEYTGKAGVLRDEAVVVAFSNNSVYNYNLAIRQQLYPGEKNPVPGDRLVVVHNNYLHGRELLNGEIGTLVSINTDHTHIHPVTVRLPRAKSKDETEYKVILRFLEAVIRFTDTSGICDVTCMIIGNVLYSGRRDLTYLENVALLVDFKSRWGAHQKTGKTDFRTDMRADPFFNAVRVKFGYALTCHKAQGGEWKHVFVQCATGMGYNNEYYFRWLYTAITRAREQLLLINAPSFNDTTLMKEAGDPFGDTAQKTISGNPNQERLDTFIHGLIQQIEKVTSDAGYSMLELRELPYSLQFTLQKGLDSALIRIHYSARLQVTSLEGLNGEGEVGPEMLNIFGFLNLPAIDKVFHPKADTSSIPANTLAGAVDFLLQFRNRIESIVASEEIQVVKVESYPWQEIYFFESGLKYAAIKFYYNKKKQFTRYQVIPTQSNGLEINLIPLLKNMDL